MKDIKVSIIIPVYNVEKYLKECLQSAINQSLKEIEIICINDGSTDSSLNILEEYEKKYNNIIIINQDNKGQSSARNRGLEVAKGEYIYFLDSDDIIDLNLCKECYKIAKVKDSDILVFDADIFCEEEFINENSITNYHIEKNLKDSYNRKAILTEKHINGQEFFNKCIKKNAYRSAVWLHFFKASFINSNNLRFYEGIIYEDELFTTKAYILSSITSYVPRKYFKRRYRKNSTITSKKTDKNINGYYTVAKELYKFYLDRAPKLNTDTKNSLLEYISIMYSNAYFISRKLKNKKLKDEISYDIKSNRDIYNIKNKKIIIKINFPLIIDIYKRIKNK